MTIIRNAKTLVFSGKGEFGEVLLSKAKGIEDNEEETVVLVKSLQSRDEQLQQDFRREAEMFGKLSHSSVVRLLGLCRETEPHYMILEYYDLVNTQTDIIQYITDYNGLNFLFLLPSHFRETSSSS